MNAASNPFSRASRSKRRGRRGRRKNRSRNDQLSGASRDGTDHVASSKVVRFQPLVFGFPDRLMTSLRYHTVGSITSTSGVLGTYVFRWNSTFDPDLTSGGHQPLYRDTYAGIYDHYSVISATATILYTNGTTDQFIVGAVTDDDSSASSSIDTLCEQSHGVHTTLTALTGSFSHCKFSLQWDCKKVLGIDPFASQTYKTAVASNPSEESDLILWCADISGNTNSVTFDIELRYDVLWTELTTPTGS